MIVGIVAISRNFAIGRGGGLPWHYSADLNFFKETTMGGAVVMGSRTWTSIGRALPGRLNVVLSRSSRVETPPTVMRLHSKGEVVELAKYLNRDVFIIGGAATYAEFADVIDKWIVTEIPETIDDADTFMPRDFLNGFSQTDQKELGDGLRVKVFQR